jgi:glyoxylase-like metal-dependent hydrolase (beta-lactamase superfamily II)
MLLESRAVAPFYKNGFVLGCEETGQAIVIDPGDEVDALLDVVAARRLDVVYILLTHAHIDHVTGVGRAKAALGAPIGLHRDDLFLYERAPEIGGMYGMTVAPLPPVDFFYDDAGPLWFGRYSVHIHHTPGHCPGGVCLAVRKGRDGQEGQAGQEPPWLFVGDTLFAGSIGRTDLPGGDHPTLIRSIKDVLFAFGDEAVVYPGHGEATTIGTERRTNPFLLDG